jgi:hypothetical protein
VNEIPLLDYFAAKAMHAMLSNSNSYYDPTRKEIVKNSKTQSELCAEEAYLMAGEMLKARRELLNAIIPSKPMPTKESTDGRSPWGQRFQCG